MPFQATLNYTQAPAVAGDFASANPRRSVPGNIGAWVAGPSGVTVGTFAWGDQTVSGTVLANTGSGKPTGFVAREFGDAMITTYLAESGNVIQGGFPVPVFDRGDFWAKNSLAGPATIGFKAFANTSTGVIGFAAAGGTVAGSIETDFVVSGWGGGTGLQNELVKISA